MNGKAHIELDVTVNNPNTNVPAKQQEINRALKQVINKQLGLQMADVRSFTSSYAIHQIYIAPDGATTPAVSVETPVKVNRPSPMSSIPSAMPHRALCSPASEVIRLKRRKSATDRITSTPAQRTASWSTRIARRQRTNLTCRG